MIRVLLAEDQVLFRTAVRRLLELEDDIEVARGDEIVLPHWPRDLMPPP